MLLENKIALVTGAGSGIGRASTLRLAREGAMIAVSDVNVPNGEETVQQIKAMGGEAFFMKCDVARPEEVEAFVEATVQRFGGLDVAVNNAGVGGTLMNADALDEATWDFVMNVNLKGVWLCMKYEIPQMVKRGGGAIVNIASIAGLLGFRGNAAYSASKHGVIGLTKSTALEVARQGIRVNAICPGFTETSMVTTMIDEVPRMKEGVMNSSPMRRLGRVEEIADAVLYMASDMSSFVNGHALAIDGGTVAM
ncbi:MAG: glucose 1-dehydrogenase [Chitinophagaceae bacterium]|nr:glucose 1-dehydrogenase [Anaerolineae bacterium]